MRIECRISLRHFVVQSLLGGWARLAPMPIIDVEIVGPITEAVRAGLAQRIADAAGAALNSGPQGTWVKVRYLAEDAYAENDGSPRDGGQPVFVSVLVAELADRTLLSEQAVRLASAVAVGCGRSTASVHIIFEPAGAGRVAFGGQLRK